MAMGNRPEVQTAPAPVVALDVVLGIEQMSIALARLPFRHPFAGKFSPLENLGVSVTHEVIRTFMGYASALRIPEFRSLELFLDEICSVVMPPFVRALDVASHRTELGGVPGILYRSREREPLGVILYLHGGGYIGTSPEMYAFFTSRVCKETECAVFVADYRLAPEFPYPAGAEDASAVFAALIDLGIPPERILLAGDSGGGGLANTVLLDPERTDDDVPGRAGPVLTGGRPAPRRAVGDRERRARHLAVEHPDGLVPPWRRRIEPVGVALDGGPEPLPAHLRHLGRRRDVPRPNPPLRRAAPRGRGAHRGH